MNNATRLLALYVRDLLALAEGTVVVIGRTNVKRNNTSALQVVVDQLATSVPITDTQRYDGTGEIMHIDMVWSGVMTLDFMGATAYNEAVRFVTLHRHQQGHDLRVLHGIDLGMVSGITDLKILQGEQYSERYQVELTMTYGVGAPIPTKRIDTAIFNPFLID